MIQFTIDSFSGGISYGTIMREIIEINKYCLQ
jgi:hypothetical protein